MQTQQPDSGTIGKQSTPSSTSIPPRRRRRWLAGLGALLVVGLVIASSVVVFSLVSRSHVPGKPQVPPSGQWKALQQGYLFLSIKAAASNPAELYACATTSAAISNQGTPGAVTILHSSDSGDTWQNIGANMLQGSACQLAVNPTNSEDIYVFSGGNTSQAPATLHHSTDGGKTWQAIQPSLTAPSIPATQRLYLQQLEYADNSLLAIDSSIRPLPIVSPPDSPLALTRLVRSADGGHTWTIIDAQFSSQGLGAQSFAVDPTQATTIYELLGHSWLPIERVQPDGILPIYGINQQLYKTTDGGAHWTLALAQAPFGSSVQLAAGNPAIVYVGGVLGPIPLPAQTPQENRGTTLPQPIGGFHLMVSLDGGASWKTVATPLNQETILNWFVGADGRVFASPATPFILPGVSATTIVGTAIAGTAVPVPPQTPQSGTGRPPLSGTSQSVTVNSSSSASPPSDVSPLPGKSYIMSYNPADNNWSKVTTPPENGEMLAVTPSGATAGAMLWFMGTGTTGTSYTLFRYVV